MEYIFETRNLKIRRFEIQDAQKLYENHLEEEVKKWIPNESYADIQEAREAIRFYAECVNEKHLPFVLAVELKENGEFKFSSIQEYMASAVGGSNWRNYNVTNRWCCWCFSIC